MVRKAKTFTRKKLLVALGLIALVFTLVTVLEVSGKTHFFDRQKKSAVTNNDKNNQDSDTATPAMNTQQDIDMSPASETDNIEINKRKESESPNPSGTTAPATATVTIVRANVNKSTNTLEVRGITSNVTNGSCKAMLVSGATTIATASTNIRNTGTTYDCDVLNISLTGVAAGSYSVMIQLNSGDITVTSEAMNVSI